MTAKIYIKPYDFKVMTWDNVTEIPFTEYSIDESDFRNKTAKFKTDQFYDVSTKSWAVKIVNPNHETFTGIILKRDMKPNSVYEYSCQDWNKLYMAKPDWNSKANVHSQIKSLLKFVDEPTKGLMSKSKYDQKKYGSDISFNPMTNKQTVNVKDKTVKEIIQNLVYGQKPYIDIHYNNTGTMLFTPYYFDKWLQSTADFHYTECTDFSYNFDTTNIVNSVKVGKTVYDFKKLFNSSVDPLSNMIFTRVNAGDDNKTTSTSKTQAKASKTNSKTSNVYGTKNKEVWVNMDNCWGHSTDVKYINTFCAELKKLGWKVHNLGPGSQIHTNYSLAGKCKKAIWLTLDNGADCEVFRHFGHDKWFKGQLVKNGSRAVLGLINYAGDIRKGGKYYKYLGMAHDGTGKGNPGLRYPAGYMADCGLPWFYSRGNNPKAAAQKFNAGGDSEIALNNKYSKKIKGYYANWNWSSKY